VIIIIQGSLDEMLFWTFKFAGKYVSEISFKRGMEMLQMFFSRIITGYLVFWILGVVGLVLIFFLKISKQKKIILLSFAFLSALTVVPGLHFYGHYWIQMLPALSVFIAITIMLLVQLFSKIFKVIIFAAFSMIIILNLYNNKKYYFNPDYTEILHNVYNGNPFPEDKVIGDFIKKNTTEEDKIMILGSEPQIFIYSGRRCASKHFYISFMMGDTLMFPQNKNWQMEFIDDINREQPKYLVYYNHPLSILAHVRANNNIYKMFNEVAFKNYKMIGIVDIISSFKTKYIWYDDVKGYKYSGKYNIFIFEKKI
jgi:hypothetical protein